MGSKRKKNRNQRRKESISGARIPILDVQSSHKATILPVTHSEQAQLLRKCQGLPYNNLYWRVCALVCVCTCVCLVFLGACWAPPWSSNWFPCEASQAGSDLCSVEAFVSVNKRCTAEHGILKPWNLILGGAFRLGDLCSVTFDSATECQSRKPIHHAVGRNPFSAKPLGFTKTPWRSPFDIWKFEGPCKHVATEESCCECQHIEQGERGAHSARSVAKCAWYASLSRIRTPSPWELPKWGKRLAGCVTCWVRPPFRGLSWEKGSLGPEISACTGLLHLGARTTSQVLGRKGLMFTPNE